MCTIVGVAASSILWCKFLFVPEESRCLACAWSMRAQATKHLGRMLRFRVATGKDTPQHQELVSDVNAVRTMILHLTDSKTETPPVQAGTSSPLTYPFEITPEYVLIGCFFVLPFVGSCHLLCLLRVRSIRWFCRMFNAQAPQSLSTKVSSLIDAIRTGCFTEHSMCSCRRTGEWHASVSDSLLCSPLSWLW